MLSLCHTLILNTFGENFLLHSSRIVKGAFILKKK